VRLAIRNDKIIGEFHKRLSNNEKVPQQKDTIKAPVSTVHNMGNPAASPTPSMAVQDVVTLLKQMLTLAKNNGGLGQETQITALKQQIETLPKPARGDRKAARLQNDKGLEAVKNERFDQALQYFLTASQLDPGDVEIVNNVGFAALKAGNLPDAATYLGKALSMAPSRASAWSDLANVYTYCMILRNFFGGMQLRVR
jgi:tetratricopeptide (TPR) repeat protein